MSTTGNQRNAAWLTRANVLAGSSLAGYRLPQEVDFVVDRAQGTRIWDVDGREYIDYLLGSGPLILGHAHPEVTEAVTEQLLGGSTYYALNRPAIELAEVFAEAVPCAERVRFVSTGAEATACALRLARAHTGRSLVLKFEGGYHGSHDAALLSFAPATANAWPDPVPDSAGIPVGVRHDVLVAPYNDAEQTAAIARAHGADLAAIIVEPMQRGIPPIPGFLHALRQLADELGAILIFDEVVTGFRVAYGGAQQFYGVVPDIAALGKIVGGGFPLAAIVGRTDILDHVDTARKGQPDYVHLSGTLSGNPIAATAGLATLRVLRKPGVYDRLHRAGESLRAGLMDVAMRYGVPLTVVGDGPLAAVHFTEGPVRTYRDVLKADKSRLARVNAELVRRGILVQLSTKFYLSVVHSDADLNAGLEAFDAVLSGVEG